MSRLLDATSLGIAAFVSAYGVYLVLLGPILTVVTPSDGSLSIHDPNPVGMLPLALGLATGYGIVRHDERWVWVGAIGVIAFSVLFVFGVGGGLIPVAIALLISLLARRAAN